MNYERFKELCLELFPEAQNFTATKEPSCHFSAEITLKGEPCTIHILFQSPHEAHIYSNPPLATFYSVDKPEARLRDFAKEVRRFC